MAKQTINVGTTANDKKGDSLRAAFQKVNANFTDLYTALGLNADTVLNLGAFEFTGSTISTTDSTSIIIDQATTIASDLTVGGDVLPSVAYGSNLGSPTKPFKSLYVSTNTVFLGGVPLSLAAGTNELTINNVPISQTINFTDITGQSSLYKPEAIIDYRSGSYYNSTAVPAGSVIIDQATYRWATDSGASSYRDTVFQPSVYSATIDGSGNITDIQITTARSYPNSDIYPDFINYELINTDNMVAIDSGIDITDPVAIAASSIFEILEVGIISIAKPIPTDISELEDIGGLLTGGGTGDVTFTNTTVSAPDDTAITVQAKDADSVVTAELYLDPGNGQARLTGTSNEDSSYFTTDSWDTAVWNGTTLSFTNAPTLVSFIETANFVITGISVNDGPKIDYDGASYGGGNIGLIVTEVADPNPTTITDILIYYRFESRINIDYDEGTLELVTHDIDIDINSSNSISVNADQNININGRDYFALRNYSTTVPIRIVTDGNNTEKTWEFGADGKTTFPSNTIKTAGSLIVQAVSNIPTAVTAVTGSSGSWEMNPMSDLATTGGSGTGLRVNVTQEGGYAGAITIATAGTGYTNGDTITVTSGSSNATFTISTLNAWNFNTNGRTTFPNGVVPEHSYGAAGDKEGMVVFTDPYIYYCKQDYVDNTTDIWVRVAWTDTNW